MAHPQSGTTVPSPQADSALWSADDVVGTYRRFGEIGPVYEVLGLDDGRARICVVESGEIVSYPIEEVRKDPLA